MRGDQNTSAGAFPTEDSSIVPENVDADMGAVDVFCQLDKKKDPATLVRAKMRARCVANSGEIADDLSKRCGNQPARQPLVFGRAKGDEAFCRKFMAEHRLANMKGIAVIQATDTIGDDSKRQHRIRHEEDSDENAWLLGMRMG